MEVTDILNFSLKKYPNIGSMVCEKDKKKWNLILSKYINPITDYIEKSKFNLLICLLTENYFQPSEKLLNYLEGSLNIFPQLKESGVFNRNIKILEDNAFLSFLSELSLARYLLEQGFALNFNKNYTRVKNGNTVSRDIDIAARNKDNQTIYFEIYTPNSQTDINGFFDLSSFGESFKRKLNEKSYDKFDNLVTGQFDGQIFLSINYAYDDRFKIFLTSPFSAIFDNIEKMVVERKIDGVLLFHHDLVKEDSLRFDWLIGRRISE